LHKVAAHGKLNCPRKLLTYGPEGLMSAGASTIVASTLQELEKARSEADNQRIAIEVMKYATPLEIDGLLQSMGPSPFRNWLRGLHVHVTRHTGKPAAFDCDYSSEAVSRYSNGGNSKTLIAGFCGKSQLIHGPTAVLLQNLPQSCDILILRDLSRMGFSKGVPGYADSFQEFIEKLRAEFDLDRYEDIRCMGGSSGAAAAFAAGQLLNASKLVSFSGRPPSLSRRYGESEVADGLERHIAEGPAGPDRAFAVFGADNANDVNGADALTRLLNVTLIPIDGVADHNIIRPLHVSGELPGILQRVGLL
jgi:hypothetical protein